MSYIKLSPEELGMLEALVGAPVFKVLKKLCDQQKEIIKNKMVTADSLDQLRTLQGQIAGVNQITSIPEILAQGMKIRREAQEKKQKAEKPRRG